MRWTARHFHETLGLGRRRAAACLFLAVWLPVWARAETLAPTFDDLPLNGEIRPGTTRVGIVRDVLAILESRKVPPVYGFVNAKRMEDSQDGADALRAWIAGGQLVGNHSYSHTDLTEVRADRFLEDVERNQPVLELLGPAQDWRWFRYPYLHEGDTLAKRDAVRAGLERRHYQIAQVTIDWEDYLWNSPFARCSAQHDEKSLAWLHSSYLSFASQYIDGNRQMAVNVFGHPINHVLLLHLGAFSSTILPELFDLLRDKGFSLDTLENVERDPAYRTNPNAALPNGGTLLEQWTEARHLDYPPLPKKPYKKFEQLCR